MRIFFIHNLTKIIFIIVLIASAFFIPRGKAWAETMVSGVISHEIHWTGEESPVIVDGSVPMVKGSKLTIDPGVVVKFTPGSQLLEGEGAITAVGSADQPIIFTSIADDIGGDSNLDADGSLPAAGNWERISISNPADQISHAEFRYGTNCLDLDASIVLSDVKIDKCQKGIFLRPSFEGTIEHSEITNCNYGIYVLDFLEHAIKYNRISQNIYGIYFSASKSVEVSHNDIFDNTSGLVANSTEAVLRDNNIYGNTQAGFDNSGSTIVDATGNWWGDVSGPLNFIANPGGLGNQVSDRVSFGSWATEAFDNNPIIVPPPLPDPEPESEPPPEELTPPPADDEPEAESPPADPGPDSEPSGLRPVVIIPGIMGSELYDGNDLIWPNISRLAATWLFGQHFLSEELNLDNQGNSIKNITVGDIVKKVPTVDIFNSLINQLTNNGYVINQNLFVFPYDWRLDLDISRDELAQKIEDIQTQTNFQKVDIIAHSMGGLVTADYVKRYGTSTINQLIFVGTPHLGAPKAANALLSGDLNFPYYSLDPEPIKKIALNSPAIYELLPSQKYFDVYQGYINAVPQDGVLDYAGTKDFLSFLGKNSSLIHNAQSFFDQDLEDLDYGEIQVSNIVGCKRASTRDFYTINESNRTIIGVRYSNGDGTVPFVSADYSSGMEYYVKNADHGQFPSMDGVKQLIAGILAGQEILSANISHNANFCPLNGKELNWRSPVAVQIYDALGNHSGPLDDGIIENNIPDVAYEMIDGEAYIFLPTDDGQTYTVQGTGTGTGSFDLIVSDIHSDEVINNTLFNDVQIISGSSISFTVSQDSDDNHIEFDFNNNGNIVDLPASNQFIDQAQALMQATSMPVLSPAAEEGIRGSGSSVATASEPKNAKDPGKPDENNGKILGEVIEKLPDGTLVLDIADNRTVYMIGNGGKKYGFTSEFAFRGLGFRFDLVVSADLSQYELGGLITDPKGIHPNGSVISDGRTVWFINHEKRFGFSSLKQLQSYGFDSKQIVPANNNDMLLLETNLLNKN